VIGAVLARLVVSGISRRRRARDRLGGVFEAGRGGAPAQPRVPARCRRPAFCAL